MENLDMDGLRAFVAIAETMSFSRAADAIGRSQPAVSLRLRNLERAVGGALLFRRQGRVIGLTPEGRALLGYAQRIIQMNDQALRGLGVAGSQRVRVGVSADMIGSAMVDALQECRAAYPRIRLEVEADVSSRLQSRCLAGELDIALFKGVGGEAGQPLRQIPLVWAGTRVAKPKEVQALAVFPPGCAYRQRMEAALAQDSRTYAITVTTPSLDSLFRALKAGMAVSALPEHLVRHEAGLRPLKGFPDLAPVTLSLLSAPGAGAMTERVAHCLAERLCA